MSKYGISAKLADIPDTSNFCFVIFIVEEDGFHFFDWFLTKCSIDQIRGYVQNFLKDIETENPPKTKPKYNDLINSFDLRSEDGRIMEGGKLSQYYQIPNSLTIYIVRKT